MRSFLIVALLVVASVALDPVPAEACTCMPSGPPCEAAWQTDAIFRARVVSVTRGPAQGNTPGARIVRMQIVEAFTGVQGERLDVTTASDGAMCGYDFEAGRDYVVYARSSVSGFTTSICSRTRPVEEAGDDLSYLRALASGRPMGGEILGEVRHSEPWSEAGLSIDEPRSGVRVTVAGGGLTREAISDDGGRFTVGGLAPGAYDVTAEEPDGFYVTAFARSGSGMPGRVVLAHARACAAADITLGYDGRISGRILDASGSPVPHVFVQAVRVEEAERPGGRVSSFLTDETGRFEIARLPEGRFVVGLHVKRAMDGPGLPRVMVPGTSSIGRAQVVSLTGGERVVLPDLTLPGNLAFVTLRGVVIGRDGRPETDALVYLHMPGRRGIMFGAPVPVSETGEFAFAVLPGERYEVQATLRGAAPGPPEHVEAEFAVALGSEPPMLRLEFK